MQEHHKLTITEFKEAIAPLEPLFRNAEFEGSITNIEINDLVYDYVYTRESVKTWIWPSEDYMEAAAKEVLKDFEVCISVGSADIDYVYIHIENYS